MCVEAEALSSVFFWLTGVFLESEGGWVFRAEDQEAEENQAIRAGSCKAAPH